MENPDRYHGITKEDIVRSSLWMHEQKIKPKYLAFDVGVSPAAIAEQFPGLENAGAVPGAFAVPVCRNPRGEAISSVWFEDDKHYPCRCGEVPSWTDKSYKHVGKTESQQFYIDTGLYASDHFEWHCQKKTKCHGLDDEDWTWNLPPGSPPHEKDLKHPWKQCEHPGKHETWGAPNRDT